MTTTVAFNKPTLRVGASGTAVRELQELLRDYATYIGSQAIRPGAIDGVFGNQTVKAVQAFQKQVFLPTTGVVANLTWRSLFLRAPVDLPILRQGNTGVVVEMLQTRLTILLNRRINVDGDFGPMTRRAVIDFQRSVGLPQTEIVDEATWFALSKRAIA
jgi:peptidoglycan hydrolase-like protein with peptidoglycan-binding domain